jgi:hypothetical protein
VTNGDFVMMTEADLAGVASSVWGKANHYVKREVSYVVRDNGVQRTAELTVRYRNDGAPSVLNVYYGGYLRVYVPLGVTLLDAGDGYRDEGRAPDGPYEVLSKSVELLPGEEETITFRYALPASLSGDDYRLTWIHQPGTPDDVLKYNVPGAAGTIPADRRLFTVAG